MSLQIDRLCLQREDGVGLLGPLDLRLDPGRRLGLIGESGSGKSLLLQALFGVLPRGVVHAGGTASAFGIRLDTLSPGGDGIRGPRLAWVPQDPWQALHPQVSLGEHLALLPSLHRGESEAQTLNRLAPLLDQLGLPRDPGFLARLPHQVSGGQRQRICLAMALSCDPELLLLDEPTTSLDGPAQAGFVRLLLVLQQERNLGFLWITHDLGLADAACDQVLVMYGGVLVEAGPTRRVLGRPRHPYTDCLLEGARRRPIREAGFLPAPQDRHAGCVFLPRCPRPLSPCHAGSAWRGDSGDGFRCNHPLAVPG